MTTDRFEIRVALIGHVSVGKSTLLNALLGDKYSEISMNRTTAGVNMFRIINKKDGGPNKKIRSEPTSSSSSENVDDADNYPIALPLADTPTDGALPSTRSAKSTHAEIRLDNKRLRSNSIVQEKTFDIEIDEPICEMRENTDLVLVDVPGINEADSSSKYKDYVTKNWSTFDLIILVMDAIQGVNTEEQVELLKYVKKNNNEKKHIRTVIVGNKMDDPDDIEKIQLVEEAREKVVEIFGDWCTKWALEAVLKWARDGNPSNLENISSVFIPMSALHAFIYRKATQLTLAQFQEFDRVFVDKIGHEEVGRKWRQFTEKQKFETIHVAVSDPLQYKERLSTTNFDNFLELLAYFLGGDTAQFELQKRQLDFELENLSHDTCIADQIHSIYRKAQSLGYDTIDVATHFWRIMNQLIDESVDTFLSDVDPTCLSRLLVELSKYNTLACHMEWKEEKEKIKKAMDFLVRCQIETILEMQKGWDFSNWFDLTYKQRETNTDVYEFVKPHEETWMALSPNDWMVILKSLLRAAHLYEFLDTFGAEKDILEELLLFYNVRFNPRFAHGYLCEGNDSSNRKRKKKRKFAKTEKMFGILNGNKESSQYKAIVKLEMPSSLSDPRHWGHLAWEYCKFRRSVSDDWCE